MEKIISLETDIGSIVHATCQILITIAKFNAIKLAEEGCEMHYISEVMGHDSLEFTRIDMHGSRPIRQAKLFCGFCRVAKRNPARIWHKTVAAG